MSNYDEAGTGIPAPFRPGRSQAYDYSRVVYTKFPPTKPTVNPTKTGAG